MIDAINDIFYWFWTSLWNPKSIFCAISRQGVDAMWIAIELMRLHFPLCFSYIKRNGLTKSALSFQDLPVIARMAYSESVWISPRKLKHKHMENARTGFENGIEPLGIILAYIWMFASWEIDADSAAFRICHVGTVRINERFLQWQRNFMSRRI